MVHSTMNMECTHYQDWFSITITNSNNIAFLYHKCVRLALVVVLAVVLYLVRTFVSATRSAP